VKYFPSWFGILAAAGFLRREDEKLEAGQVRQIIAAPLTFSI